MTDIRKIVIATAAAVCGLLPLASPAGAAQDGRHGYGNWQGGGRSTAVNACVQRADTVSRGRVRVTDVERRDNNRFRVRGVVDRRDRRDTKFRCTARGNGRIVDFDWGKRG